MKKNREVLKPEIRLKSEKNNTRREVFKGNVILTGNVYLLLGFVLGATVAILNTSRETKLATSVEEIIQSRSV